MEEKRDAKETQGETVTSNGRAWTRTATELLGEAKQSNSKALAERDEVEISKSTNIKIIF